MATKRRGLVPFKGTIERAYRIVCGECVCGAVSGTATFPRAESAAVMVCRAREAGWRRERARGWVCPDCLAREAEETGARRAAR